MVQGADCASIQGACRVFHRSVHCSKTDVSIMQCGQTMGLTWVVAAAVGWGAPQGTACHSGRVHVDSL